MKHPSCIVSIPTPCTQGWQDMTPVAGGRHCQSCAKSVTDFSKLSDTEIIRVLLKNKDGVCGRMRTNQLNRMLISPQEQKSSSFFAKALAGVLLLSASADVSAQNQLPGEEIVMTRAVTETGEEAAIKKEPVAPRTDVGNRISGTVKTNYGENVLCSITLDNTFFCVNTNENGFFEMEVPDSLMQDTLAFTITGTYLDPVKFQVLRTQLPAQKDIIIHEEPLIMGALEVDTEIDILTELLLLKEIRLLEENLKKLEMEKELKAKKKND